MLAKNTKKDCSAERKNSHAQYAACTCISYLLLIVGGYSYPMMDGVIESCLPEANLGRGQAVDHTEP